VAAKSENVTFRISPGMTSSTARITTNRGTWRADHFLMHGWSRDEAMGWIMGDLISRSACCV
jgi:hypothetical protein